MQSAYSSSSLVYISVTNGIFFLGIAVCEDEMYTELLPSHSPLRREALRENNATGLLAQLKDAKQSPGKG